ncbi:UDP-2,3-diacylglucosamine diphosphatase [Allopusillimonas ginsengisoli]|uniref:UDP-2,3-diacylglucosamine diphosphatase n=1 Tax=Allopusillimonas ginsengisoli TaxID=453575 RepID=UPI001FD6569E|nr:UDP-2,3-diacylglucosamine diphosphatase [Allopusillimonas ginsengisoli]
MSNRFDRLALPGTLWIASDIHLGPDVPATASAFHQFLDDACARADALILCGDIFDAWIGDDLARKAPPAWLSTTMEKLRHVSSRIPLWLGRGNRDFLLGPDFAKAVGARVLPDAVILETAAGPVLLSHGDEYCTDDAGYQRFRRLVRRPAIQSVFLALSLSARRWIADYARARSKASNQYKSANIMDVSPDAIALAFERSGAQIMVHGHTHRPAIHTVVVSDRPCSRIVLPDWEYDHATTPRGGWLSIDSAGPQLHSLT